MLKNTKEIAEVLLSIICYYIALLPIYFKIFSKVSSSFIRNYWFNSFIG